jgi:hypothetical protein
MLREFLSEEQPRPRGPAGTVIAKHDAERGVSESAGQFKSSAKSNKEELYDGEARQTGPLKQSIKRWQDAAHALFAGNEFLFID